MLTGGHDTRPATDIQLRQPYGGKAAAEQPSSRCACHTRCECGSLAQLRRPLLRRSGSQRVTIPSFGGNTSPGHQRFHDYRGQVAIAQATKIRLKTVAAATLTAVANTSRLEIGLELTATATAATCSKKKYTMKP